MMSVCGCIDSLGYITARASKGISTHRPNESIGKRWRWLVQSQEFHSLAPKTVEEANNRISMLHLNDEEHFAVCDYLIKNGYAHPDILPEPNYKEYE